MYNNFVRQIVLDTETTGMNKYKPHYEGHRIIEIGAVEIINRQLTSQHFHVYLNPGRSIDPEALSIHGINEDFLHDKPKFSEISSNFLNFISGSELIVHNASFDIGFIDYEFSMLQNHIEKISVLCKVTDTLQLARKLFPGKKNNLNALCERYCIDISGRGLHGALLDARLLADVFLSMTGGQISMFFMEDHFVSSYISNHQTEIFLSKAKESFVKSVMKVVYANTDEIMLHEEYLNSLEENSIDGCCIWRNKCSTNK